MRMRILCEGAHPPASTYSGTALSLFKLDQEIELKMAFSPEFEPPELAKWLLEVYGQSYRDDITKLESESLI